LKYRYIAIEGNIGAGKSTLAKLLSDHYGALYVPEAFEENSFLPMFYADQQRYALPLELSFLADRYRQLTGSILRDGESTVVADYVFDKCKLFAGINLVDQEYKLFEKWFDMVAANIPRPDLLIYLDAPMERLLANIKTRGRNYEQEISGDYLGKLDQAYRQFLAGSDLEIMVVDMSGVDFIAQHESLRRVIKMIEERGALHEK